MPDGGMSLRDLLGARHDPEFERSLPRGWERLDVSPETHEHIEQRLSRTGSSDADDARFADIVRRPRVTASISGVVVLVAAVVGIAWLDEMSWPLMGVAVIAGVIGGLALWNVVNFSPRVIARLERLASQIGGRFTPWAPGAGGNTGNPFARAGTHQRFGVLKYADQGTGVEIGHLATELAGVQTSPMGRYIAYVAIRLPERLPHMFLRGVWGVQALVMAWMPASWHRSQLVEVDGDRRLRVFVGYGGEETALVFFRPDLVRVLQRVRRDFDVEVKDRTLYLYSARAVVAGSARRQRELGALISELVAALAESEVWDQARRQSGGRGPGYRPLRADGTRRALIITGALIITIAVASILALYSAGLIG